MAWRWYVLGEEQRKFEARAVLILGEENQLIVTGPKKKLNNYPENRG